MNKERLQRLADHLRTVPLDRFNMSTFGRGASEHSCGTVGCAAGHAAEIPEFQEAGYQLRSGEIWNLYVVPAFGGLENEPALMNFFDLTKEESERIFYPDVDSEGCAVLDEYGDDIEDLDERAFIGPEEVADLIEEMIHG